jgi:hypothetical protein
MEDSIYRECGKERASSHSKCGITKIKLPSFASFFADYR